MPKPVRVNQHGLVIPPSRRDCFGEACPVAEQQDACFVDRHHLYFPAANRNLTPIALEFGLCADNIIWIARCAHNRYHDQHYRAFMPSEEVMATFIDESRLKQDYFSLLRLIDIKLEVIESERASRESMQRLEDEILSLKSQEAIMKQAAVKLELVPSDLEKKIAA